MLNIMGVVVSGVEIVSPGARVAHAFYANVQ
jgi:hypothetical protein